MNLNWRDAFNCSARQLFRYNSRKSFSISLSNYVRNRRRRYVVDTVEGYDLEIRPTHFSRFTKATGFVVRKIRRIRIRETSIALPTFICFREIISAHSRERARVLYRFPIFRSTLNSPPPPDSRAAPQSRRDRAFFNFSR